jgi:hypothetical protein
LREQGRQARHLDTPKGERKGSRPFKVWVRIPLQVRSQTEEYPLSYYIGIMKLYYSDIRTTSDLSILRPNSDGYRWKSISQTEIPWGNPLPITDTCLYYYCNGCVKVA